MQQLTIKIPTRREANERCSQELMAKYPCAAQEIPTFIAHDLCSAVYELELIARELVKRGMRIQLRGAAASSQLLYQIGLSIICPKENDFLFERFLEPRPKQHNKRNLVLLAYTMSRTAKIAERLAEIGFQIYMSGDGLVVSKPDQTEEEKLLCLIVSSNFTGKGALPTYRQLLEFRRKNESSVPRNETQITDLENPERLGNDLNLNGLDADAVYQEDQMRMLSAFANVGLWEAYVLIRDVNKHGITAELTQTQIRFIEAAERVGRLPTEAIRVLEALDKWAVCKSNCYVKAAEIMERNYLGQSRDR